uniref:Uncharacterized protein n=1 Tax=Aegilops tauschii subsp. strangulata TaxID=200361 RepID=A0A453PQV3_AEGTS
MFGLILDRQHNRVVVALEIDLKLLEAREELLLGATHGWRRRRRRRGEQGKLELLELVAATSSQEVGASGRSSKLEALVAGAGIRARSVVGGEAPEADLAFLLPLDGRHGRRSEEGAARVHHRGVVHALGRLEEGVDVRQRVVVHAVVAVRHGLVVVGVAVAGGLVLRVAERRRVVAVAARRGGAGPGGRGGHGVGRLQGAAGGGGRGGGDALDGLGRHGGGGDVEGEVDGEVLRSAAEPRRQSSAAS